MNPEQRNLDHPMLGSYWNVNEILLLSRSTVYLDPVSMVLYSRRWQEVAEYMNAEAARLGISRRRYTANMVRWAWNTYVSVPSTAVMSHVPSVDYRRRDPPSQTIGDENSALEIDDGPQGASTALRVGVGGGGLLENQAAEEGWVEGAVDEVRVDDDEVRVDDDAAEDDGDIDEGGVDESETEDDEALDEGGVNVNETDDEALDEGGADVNETGDEETLDEGGVDVNETEDEESSENEQGNEESDCDEPADEEEEEIETQPVIPAASRGEDEPQADAHKLAAHGFLVARLDSYRSASNSEAVNRNHDIAEQFVSLRDLELKDGMKM